ncbi:8425489c-054a-4260-ab6b-52e2fac8d182-CDS [Sclerotinia trifoliorum]|uniref:8425489c-054a-4260-ab6b-52e2fac8d182-CDS n=1 Tax=Sclerotinia trifoliorum TaxID=28548 RepID=A0A8H2W752_9HELO|nr:8425489c-054a-4260-ab6b-52e2fac8d182-CDS [Sclerotinia trifoliorum]
MDRGINSPYLHSQPKYTKALPSTPTESKDSQGTIMSKTLPSLPERRSSLPERKNSKAMSIPRREVGSTSSASKKSSIASISSSGYSDSVLSRSLSGNSNFTKDSLSYAGSEFRKTPPIPEKDEQTQISLETPNKDPESPRSTSSLRSSPGQEIWRRRSLVTQKGIEFPDLKLQKSNGSTASPPSKNTNAASDRSLPEIPGQSLRSRGFSDRERGPIPTREAPQAPAVPPMGAKVSKLKDISKRKATDQIDESSRHGDLNTDQTQNLRGGNAQQSKNLLYPPQDGLPTPEYLEPDKIRSQSSTRKLLSQTTVPDDLLPSPQIPTRSDDGHAHGISAPIAGYPSTPQESSIVPDLLNRNHSRDPSETLTITSLPGAVRSPQPHKPHATKTILTPRPPPPVESASLSPSITSTTPTITTNPHSRQTSRTTTSRATSLSYSYFPLSPSALPASATILEAPPITLQHINCFQSHRFMRRSRNNICPLQCQTCSKGDFEQQWKCTWCCLRVCGDCMAVLATVRKDLRTFLGLIGSDVLNESNEKTAEVGNDIGDRVEKEKQEKQARRMNVKT